ncbi:MAG: NfeD family protein [Acidimicrobiales bacterium]|nr:NfeD family protein [Acidimicrobiales bacterium]
MDNSFVWAIIWALAAAGFGIGEAAVAGTFFLLPFAVGAAVASIASLAGAPVLVGWLIFAVASGISFFAVKPLAAKLDLDLPDPMGFGANRLVGHNATVIRAIGSGDVTGQVRVGGEVWTAMTQTGTALPAGAAVTIIEVKGNRVVVEADYFTESLKELPS